MRSCFSPLSSRKGFGFVHASDFNCFCPLVFQSLFFPLALPRIRFMFFPWRLYGSLPEVCDPSPLHSSPPQYAVPHICVRPLFSIFCESRQPLNRGFISLPSPGPFHRYKRQKGRKLPLTGGMPRELGPRGSLKLFSEIYSPFFFSSM